MQKLAKTIPLLLLLVALGLFFYFKLYNTLSFEQLTLHRTELTQWSEAHYTLSVILFMCAYAIAVAVSIPGATLFTLTGGFLFGTLLGSIYVVTSATVGATLVFLAARAAFADTLSKKAGPFVQKMEAGFQKDAFNYLLALRLIPIFPFWLVNIVPGLLNVGLRRYILATFIGIVPGTVVYVSLGSGLGAIFDAGETPNLGIILQPHIIAPLIALAFLSFLPVLYKRYKSSKQ
jgi:uncharacterized membrane protein YdjX (TVP38/TMEM64 family)